jgi:hypothetical protein
VPDDAGQLTPKLVSGPTPQGNDPDLNGHWSREAIRRQSRCKVCQGKAALAGHLVMSEEGTNHTQAHTVGQRLEVAKVHVYDTLTEHLIRLQQFQFGRPSMARIEGYVQIVLSRKAHQSRELA